MAQNSNNRTIEDVIIAFRNFAGKEDVYNREGNRTFAVLLEPEIAEKMAADGWNVKYLREREEGDGQQAYVQVAVSYKVKPPKIAMVTSKGMTYLGESEVEMLDWVDIETADVTLNPNDWAVNGKSGRKAYLKTLIIKIEEDYLEMKWRSIVEESKQLALGPADDPMVIEGEYELS
jgi:hypothetical protein